MTEVNTTNAAPQEQTEGSIFAQLQEHLRILFRHKLLIIVVTGLGAAGGYFWLKEQPKNFRAEARIVIEHQAPKILTNTNEVVEIGSPGTYRGELMYFESQYQIIVSRPVMEKVLDRVEWPPESGKNLWQSEHLLGLDQREDMTPQQKAEVLAAADMPAELGRRLTVEPIKNSFIVSISMEDPNGEFAKAIVNETAKAYEETNIEHRRLAVDDALDELKKLRAEWEEKTQAAGDAVRKFELDNNVGTIPNGKKAIDERLGTLNAQLTEARVKIISARDKAKVLRAYRHGSWRKLNAMALLSDGVLRTMRKDIAALEAKLSALRTRYLDKHPDVVALESQLASLKRAVRLEIQGLSESAQKEYEHWVAYEEGLRKELELAKAEEQRLADIERTYKRKTDQLKQFKSQYVQINKRYIETTTSSQVEVNNVRPLEKAIFPQEVRPRRALILGAATVGGFLLALLLAFLLEFSDSRIRDWRDLEERLGYKVLGVIPVISEERRLVGEVEPPARDLYISEHPRSNVAEAWRALRTNLLFMSTAHPIKTLLITSAEPAEGKTTVAVSTAISMAQSGARVLLVEGDMRRPRMARSFGVSSDRGLTTLLASDGRVSEHVQTTVDGLDVMVCGPIPPNPAELLHTERFKQVFEQFREEYDTIIFDSPPVAPVADALVLAGKVDGCLVVVRAGRTSRHALRHAYNQLAGVGGYMLGTVLNHREQPKRGYRRGYGYGYSYGYRYAKPYTADGETS